MAAAAMRQAAVAEDVEFADYDQDDEDAMEEDDRTARALPVPQIGSPTLARTRGRFSGRSPSVLASNRHSFDSLPNTSGQGHGPQRSIEGWTIIVSGVKEDAEEIDLHDVFSEFGQIKDLHYNLERRTGYAKGYALIEYGSFEEAQRAISAMNGAQLLTKTIYVDWAFSIGPVQKFTSTRPSRPRSRTPPRRLAALTPM